jgi:hypothetical protein
MKKVNIKISGRKIEGYPTVTQTIVFETIEEFIDKADKAIEETCFGKVDCYVDNSDEVFDSLEVEILEQNFFIVD